MEKNEQNKRVSSDKFKPLGYQSSKKNVMDYKVKTSNKYNNVKTVLDTGTTVRDVVYQSDKFISKRKQENFKRIRVRTLNELLKQDKQIESIYDLVQQDQDCASSIMQDNQSEVASVQNYSHFTTNSNAETNNINAVIKAEQKLGLADDSPFLLLDVREESDFQQYKIKESISFPVSQLKRDRVIPQILRYQNKEGKLIIIYAFDEKQGIPIARIFFEKGYDNVYLLSGGIEKFAQIYPETVEGSIPASILSGFTASNTKKGDQAKTNTSTTNPINKEKKVLFQRMNQDDKSVNMQSVKDKELNIKTFFKQKKPVNSEVKENESHKSNQPTNQL